MLNGYFNRRNNKMNLIKSQEFNKEIDGNKFIIKLEYGLREDKKNHVLKINIIQILDEKTGKKAEVYQDDITDVSHIPNIYGENKISLEEAAENIQGLVEDQIRMVINSKKNQRSMESLLDKLYEEGI